MPKTATAAETAVNEIHSVAPRLSIAWIPTDYYQPTAEVVDQVTQAVHQEVPATVLDTWRNGQVPPLFVDAQGRKSLATLRAYAQARLDELNAHRPSITGGILLTGGDQAAPRSTVTVYIGGELVYVPTYSLSMGGGPWVPVNEPGVPPVALGLRIAWTPSNT